MKWVLVLMVLMGGAGYGWYLNRPGADAPLYQAVALSRGELFQSVTASGQLNPVVKVEVGSQISGSIQKLFADFNSPVKEAQIVARIDPATYEAALIQAEGNPNIQYTEYPGVGHDCWDLAYSDPKVIAWLLAQKR